MLITLLLSFQLTSIDTVDQFLTLSDTTDSEFVLTQDLDFKNIRFTPQTFLGTFDGAGNQISNVVIDQPIIENGIASYGLFYKLCKSSFLSNLFLKNVSVVADGYKQDIDLKIHVSLLVTQTNSDIEIINVTITNSSIQINSIQNQIIFGGLVAVQNGNVLINNSFVGFKAELDLNPLLSVKQIVFAGLIGLQLKKAEIKKSEVQMSFDTSILKKWVEVAGFVGFSYEQVVIYFSACFIHANAPSELVDVSGILSISTFKVIVQNCKIVIRGSMEKEINVVSNKMQSLEALNVVSDAFSNQQKVQVFQSCNNVALQNIFLYSDALHQKGFTDYLTIEQIKNAEFYNDLDFAEIWQLVDVQVYNQTSNSAFLNLQVASPCSFFQEFVNNKCYDKKCVDSLTQQICGGQEDQCREGYGCFVPCVEGYAEIDFKCIPSQCITNVETSELCDQHPGDCNYTSLKCNKHCDEKEILVNDICYPSFCVTNVDNWVICDGDIAQCDFNAKQCVQTRESSSNLMIIIIIAAIVVIIIIIAIVASVVGRKKKPSQLPKLRPKSAMILSPKQLDTSTIRLSKPFKLQQITPQRGIPLKPIKQSIKLPSYDENQDISFDSLI